MKLLQNIRTKLLLWRHGPGKEYWIVKAVRCGAPCIVGRVLTQRQAQVLAFSEGQNFLSMYRQYAVDTSKKG